jgi:hypothetical protein
LKSDGEREREGKESENLITNKLQLQVIKFSKKSIITNHSRRGGKRRERKRGEGEDEGERRGERKRFYFMFKPFLRLQVRVDMCTKVYHVPT